MYEPGLKDKTVKGVAWSGIDNVAQFGVSFVVSIILARLLTPDDYGLLGIIGIFTVICTSIANGGFSIALIRKKDATEDDYNTAFIVNLVVSIFLYIIIFAFAKYIAAFFHRNELTNLIRVSSLGIVIGALSLVQQTRLTKAIDFKAQTGITIISSVISGIIGIIMALLGFGVWALVAQMLSSTSLRTLLLWIHNRWRPNFSFSVHSFNELFGFGWKMMAGSLLDNIWKQLYSVVVGRFYSPATLGQYTRANGFSELFSSNLTNVIQRVTFPVLSTIQDDQKRMVEAYRKLIKVSMFVSSNAMFFLGAISAPLLYCLIGPQWTEAASYLPLICISGSVYPLQALNLNILEVQGRSDLFLGLEIVKKFFLLVPLLVGVYAGIMPMLYVNILITIICFFLNSHYSGRYLNYSSWMQIKDIAPSYGVAIVLAASVYFFKYFPLNCWIVLPLQLLVGVTVFFLICRVFNIEEYNELVAIIRPYLRKIKRNN